MPNFNGINLVRFVQIILAWSLFTSAYLFLWTGSVDQVIHKTTAANGEPDEIFIENGFWGPAHRFPKYGTAEYARICPWALLSNNTDHHHYNNCSIYAQPNAGSGEGIAQWIAQVTAGFMLARQANCHFYLDYGSGVDLTQVLRPVGHHNWTAPAGMDAKSCNEDKQHCASVSASGNKIDRSLPRISADLRLERELVTVPYYRYFYYSAGQFPVNQKALNSSTVLPGFDTKYGMACALNALFELSPAASQFDAALFSQILPTIHDEKTLVIALYIRTGWTDIMVKAVKGKRSNETGLLEPQRKAHTYHAIQYTKCTLQLEKERIQHSLWYTRVAWLIISDSPAVKTFLHDKYHGATLKNGRGDAVTRMVLSTPSKGKHTQPQMNPSTTDFAEAMIDWYLIGESDIALSSAAYTFGVTGSLRTARPLYDAFKCELRIPEYINRSRDE